MSGGGGASIESGTPLGRVLIAPAVLAQIVERSTLRVPGVAAMCSRHPRFDRLRGRALGEHGPPSGVHVRVADETVSAEIAIIAHADANILELGHRVQQEVTEALELMVGMAVGAINVYVDDVRT
jgi:uncharacterized alkaline shock family protein YloU